MAPKTERLLGLDGIRAFEGTLRAALDDYMGEVRHRLNALEVENAKLREGQTGKETDECRQQNKQQSQ